MSAPGRDVTSPADTLRLIETYGVRGVCGAPRMMHSFEETDVDGRTWSWRRLICTADWKHLPDDPDAEPRP